MVVIRLQRGGANKRPFYHLVVADSRRAASGKFLERLGFYDPKAPQGREALRVNLERVKHWQGRGFVWRTRVDQSGAGRWCSASARQRARMVARRAALRSKRSEAPWRHGG